jgi:hypothetical protein
LSIATIESKRVDNATIKCDFYASLKVALTQLKDDSKQNENNREVNNTIIIVFVVGSWYGEGPATMSSASLVDA